MEDRPLQLDAAMARRIVLVRALEEADPEGRMVAAGEVEQVEREALEATRAGASRHFDARVYLDERARRLLEKVAGRQPAIAALQEPEPWRGWVAWGLPLAACVIGAVLDRIDNPRQVNMLSPPLLAVLLWNLVLYASLVLQTLRRGTRGAAAPAPGWLRRILMSRVASRGAGSLRARVSAAFHTRWLAAAPRLEVRWWTALLHVTAAAWGVGLAISIVLGGLVREYRVGWESTLLDLTQVHAFLSVLFAPVVALLPFDAFTLEELRRMHFASLAPPGVVEARRWVGLYLGLVAVVVVIPRAALAAFAWLRRRIPPPRVTLDVREPYYAELLSRASPVRVVLGLFAADAAARGPLLRVLREAAAPRPLAGEEWSVVTTPRDDELRVTLRPGAACDVALVVPQSPAEWAALAAQARAAGAAPLLVAGGNPEAFDGLAGGTVRASSLRDATRNWTRDEQLLGGIGAVLPAARQRGYERLVAAWQERAQARFTESMRLVARHLVEAARDSREVAAGPWSVTQWVNSAERAAADAARQQSVDALLARLRDGQAALLRELLALHGLGESLAQEPLRGVAGDRLVVHRPVHTQQATTAGAASGAAMGAGIDLMTGGLTLGAAAALGALVGGAAAFTAAHRKNRATPAGHSQVEVGDAMLQELAAAALLGYLAVVHCGRTTSGEALAVEPGWREALAAEAEAAGLQAHWPAVRDVSLEAGEAVARLARVLETTARPVLQRPPQTMGV